MGGLALPRLGRRRGTDAVRMFAQVRLNERTESHKRQSLGICGVDGRFRQRLAEVVATKPWRHLRVHQHERRRRAPVRERCHLAVDDEFEPARLSVVDD